MMVSFLAAGDQAEYQHDRCYDQKDEEQSLRHLGGIAGNAAHAKYRCNDRHHETNGSVVEYFHCELLFHKRGLAARDMAFACTLSSAAHVPMRTRKKVE